MLWKNGGSEGFGWRWGRLIGEDGGSDWILLIMDQYNQYSY
jgi:hypothetical protein